MILLLEDISLADVENLEQIYFRPDFSEEEESE